MRRKLEEREGKTKAEVEVAVEAGAENADTNIRKLSINTKRRNIEVEKKVGKVIDMRITVVMNGWKRLKFSFVSWFSLTPQFKEIIDYKQRKFFQLVIQNKVANGCHEIIRL